ncbi:hypothetical protein GUJ93_ZPchr0013g35244 [Zizania palustris]|uniref:Uncharacterized protein n=1 Tax=Zizania palustris TaxID=103762 RepID=A0A8J5WW80_ZIZPA|nr:hypothetical protein GUJ93_ZPchr0013g35244 [Zizania palustris]
MGRYHHGDITTATEEAILQAFALLHGAAITVDRHEGCTRRVLGIFVDELRRPPANINNRSKLLLMH